MIGNDKKEQPQYCTYISHSKNVNGQELINTRVNWVHLINILTISDLLGEKVKSAMGRNAKNKSNHHVWIIIIIVLSLKYMARFFLVGQKELGPRANGMTRSADQDRCKENDFMN